MIISSCLDTLNISSLSLAFGFNKGISQTSDKGTPFFSIVWITLPLESFLYTDLPFESRTLSCNIWSIFVVGE